MEIIQIIIEYLNVINCFKSKIILSYLNYFYMQIKSVLMQNQ